MKQTDIKKSFDMLRDRGGKDLKNSKGVRLNGVDYKTSQSGNNIINNIGGNFPTKKGLDNHTNK